MNTHSQMVGVLMVVLTTTPSMAGDEPLLVTNALPSGAVGEPYQQALPLAEEFTNGKAHGLSISIQGAVPPGLQIQGAVLSGIPTMAGHFTIGLRFSRAGESDLFEQLTLDIADRSARDDSRGHSSRPPTLMGTSAAPNGQHLTSLQNQASSTRKRVASPRRAILPTKQQSRKQPIR